MLAVLTAIAKFISGLWKLKVSTGVKITLLVIVGILVVLLTWIDYKKTYKAEEQQDTQNMKNLDKKLNVVIGQNYTIQAEMKEMKRDIDTVRHDVRMNTFESKQNYDLIKIIVDEQANGVKRRIDDLERKHESDREFIEELERERMRHDAVEEEPEDTCTYDYAVPVPPILHNGDVPELDAALSDTLTTKPRPEGSILRRSLKTLINILIP